MSAYTADVVVEGDGSGGAVLSAVQVDVVIVDAGVIGGDPPGAAAAAQAAAKTYTDAETSRAEAAESANATAISAETSRAQAAEAAISAGLEFKEADYTQATNVASLSGLPTPDGTTMSDGQRILLTGQSSGSQNGLWVVHSGAWARPSDYAAGSSAKGVSVLVLGGTVNGLSQWIATGTTALTVDTNVVTFQQASGLGEVTVGSGLTKTGNQLGVDTGVVDTVSARAAAITALSATYGKLASANVFTKYQTIADPTTPELHFGYAGWSNRSWWLAGGIDQSAATNMRDFAAISKGTWFAADDVSITGDGTVISSPVQANFTPAAVGATVTGPGIPPGTTILSVTSTTQAVLSAAATLGTNLRVQFQSPGTVTDVDYWSHNGFGQATLGIGKPQPSSDYRMTVIGSSIQGDAFGTLKAQAGYSPTVTAASGGVNGKGFVATFRDWSGLDHVWLDNSNSNTWALRFRGDATTSNPSIVVQSAASDTEQIALLINGTLRFGGDNAAALSRRVASAIYASGNFQVGNFLLVGGAAGRSPSTTVDVISNAGSDASFGLTATQAGGTARSPFRIQSQQAADKVQVYTNNASELALGTNATDRIRISGSTGALHFAGGTPTQAAAVTVSGSRGGNAALADLITKLAAFGLITDGTSA